MSVTMTRETETRTAIGDGEVLVRILREGYGPGAWHGPDLAAALADVTEEIAFRRPAPGRHSVAEIALHHAFCVRSVRARLTGTEPAPFVIPGDDWFELPAPGLGSWPEVRAAVEREQEGLARELGAIAEGRRATPLGSAERLDLVLGITCHAVYHAGQAQLVKRLLQA